MKTVKPLIIGLLLAGVCIYLILNALDHPTAYKGRVGPRGEVGGGWIALAAGVIAVVCFREAWRACHQRRNGQTERAKPKHCGLKRRRKKSRNHKHGRR